MFQRHHIFLVGVVCCLCACTPHSVREAQSVVEQADSLWLAGQSYADSAQLAQAYSTLHSWRSVYPDEYAHACYHYGRLLRAQDDPVAAMECFINATHTQTDDYHILGRAYSNMGDLCHMASEFSLAYDMYEHCADMYLRNGDTLLYYYGLYHMAFEKATVKDSMATISLLEIIDTISMGELPLYTALTYAELYVKCKQYPTAIQYAQKVFSAKNCNNTLSALIIAKCYSYMGEKDSATWYANMVMSQTCELYEANNALYILTNDDEKRDKDGIREAAADRSDTQKLIEIQQSRLSQAVLILEQDFNRKKDWRWLYAILATLMIVAICLFCYIFRKRKHHLLLSQQLEHLTSAASNIQEKHKKLTARYQTNHERMEEDIKRKCAVMRRNPHLTAEMEWTHYDSLCNNIDQQFYGLASDLRKKQLNETEVRLCVLVLLDMSRAEIANMLPYALNSVGKLKDHTAKKLGTTGKNLRNYLLLAVIEG
ncbi:MAG: hypothetical protein II644_01270 [Paludibacteraceae bacterium]|nr:hypothetical protein [Paludibacteraceae bacterium]